MANPPLSKLCGQCGRPFEKPRSCGLPEWQRRRFCSSGCKSAAQIGTSTAKRGRTFGPSKAMKVPCRICGQPTRYNGGPTSHLVGSVHCGSAECREASRAQKNAAIAARHIADYATGKRRGARSAWSRVPRISPEEQMLAPALLAAGWIQQLNVLTDVSDVRLPRYFVFDFALPERRLYVEIDGSVHRLRRERDARKDTMMAERGWRGLRLPAALVRDNISDAISRINRFASS